jgi:hypothetical protein
MLNKTVILDNFTRALRSAVRYDSPYLLYRFSPFSEKLYASLLSNLPESSAYYELRHPDAIRPDGSCARLAFPLKPERIRETLSGSAAQFWLELSDILRDEHLWGVFKDVLLPELERRFGSSLSTMSIYPVPVLIRDLGDYRIRIHSDIDTKVVTCQCYLPPDDSQAHLGTSIYRRSPDRSFSPVRRLPFAPRTAYCFAVSRYSWHGVEKLASRERPRDSLMLIYYRIPGIDY